MYCTQCGSPKDEAGNCPNCTTNTASASTNLGAAPTLPQYQGANAVVSGNTDSVTGLTLAGWWRRLGASMIDGLIILVVMFVLSAAHSTVPRMLQAVIFAAYHGIMLATNGGRTIGNMATGTRVISANGQAIDPTHAAIRALVDSVCGIIVIGSIVSAFMIGLHPRKQAIHDLAASTIVVLS